eukprot:1146179-Amphidinium_carterae.1
MVPVVLVVPVVPVVLVVLLVLVVPVVPVVPRFCGSGSPGVRDPRDNSDKFWQLGTNSDNLGQLNN